MGRFAFQLLRLKISQEVPRSFASHRGLARARFALIAVIPAFALVLLAAWFAVETIRPEITDPEYHMRLRLIRAAQTEHPAKPLGIVIGSSRTVWAFRPEQLPPESGVYWVNGSHVGAGPTLTRLMLHRFLRDGIQPAVAVIEVLPTSFVKENQQFTTGHFATAEVPMMCRYADQPLEYEAYFLRHRLARIPALSHVSNPFFGYPLLLSRGGRAQLEIEMSPEERARHLALCRKMNADYLSRLAVRPAADRAFRDTIREAQDNGIRVVLLRSPEGPTFRSWYNPEGLAQFDRYIAGIAAEYGVPVVDARLWLDEDDFFDSHHVLKRGADKFTTRFGRELSTVLTGCADSGGKP